MSFVRPSLDHIFSDGMQVIGRYESCRGDGGVAVDYCGLEEALNTLNHRALDTTSVKQQPLAGTVPRTQWTKDEAYINDSADCSNSIWAVYNFKVWLHVLHDTRGDHKHILRDLCEFLDNEVDHLSQSGLDSSESRNMSVSREDCCVFFIACSPSPEMLIKAGNVRMTTQPTSLCWNSLDTPKKSVVASCVPKVSPI